MRALCYYFYLIIVIQLIMAVELFGVLALVGYFVMNGIVVMKLNHENRVKKSKVAASNGA